MLVEYFDEEAPAPTPICNNAKLQLIYKLNELNKEYERQIDTKQNIAKKEENYYKYKKGNEDLVFRIGFYRNYGNILKKTTIVVHFVLIAIILIIMVYRLA